MIKVDESMITLLTITFVPLPVSRKPKSMLMSVPTHPDF